MQRRSFISQCLTAPLFVAFPDLVLSKQQQISTEIAYIAAAQSRLGEHSLHCFNHQQKLIARHDISSRGHGFAVSQQGHIAAFARRPADFCVVIDRAGNKLVEFNALPNRHFYGHGVFDETGDYLYLTENDYENARGVIGVYDVTNNYRRVKELESYGIGPHMILLDKTGSNLVVANGGIETHPNTGRKKLNIETMSSSLAFIDIQSGALVKSARLEAQYHKNSIRHISIASNNTVYLGLQNESQTSEAALLAKLTASDSEINKIELPDKIEQQLSNYVGDICLDKSEQFLAATSPYGNSLIFVSLATDQIKRLEVNDVCAVCNTKVDGEFVISGGDGKIYSVRVTDSDLKEIELVEINNLSANQHWDNHLLMIS